MDPRIKKAFGRAVSFCLAATVLATSAWQVSSQMVTAAEESKQSVAYAGETPKYIFLFIGDGMSYPQINATADYLGKLAYGDSKVADVNLPFMNFPVAGTATTFDSTSLCPDSASTATAISTGNKTHSGIINMNEDKTITYETISEKLKNQLGYKIGVVTSVSIDHATPAAFYAHQPTRGNYYEIGVELATSGFDYFAGGGFLNRTGSDKAQTDLVEVAQNNGYVFLNSKQDILNYTDTNSKVLAIDPNLDSQNALSYAINKDTRGLSLADYTQKGIELLMNETGFFMMVEGGKIDWAFHANDAATTIIETIAFSDAVDVAIDFANKHPEETLILVTGDHETGGLTIGFAGTGYSTYFEKISETKISYDEFDVLVAQMKSSITSFHEAMKIVKQHYGLMTVDDPDASKNPGMVLTPYEQRRLEQAYKAVLHGTAAATYSEEQNILYGTYNPFSVTITHILNNKAGLAFTSYAHTGLPVPVFARGVGQDLFHGYYDDTDIFHRLQAITDIK